MPCFLPLYKGKRAGFVCREAVPAVPDVHQYFVYHFSGAVFGLYNGFGKKEEFLKIQIIQLAKCDLVATSNLVQNIIMCDTI